MAFFILPAQLNNGDDGVAPPVNLNFKHLEDICNNLTTVNFADGGLSSSKFVGGLGEYKYHFETEICARATAGNHGAERAPELTGPASTSIDFGEWYQMNFRPNDDGNVVGGSQDSWRGSDPDGCVTTGYRDWWVATSADYYTAPASGEYIFFMSMTGWWARGEWLRENLTTASVGIRITRNDEVSTSLAESHIAGATADWVMATGNSFIALGGYNPRTYGQAYTLDISCVTTLASGDTVKPEFRGTDKRALATNACWMTVGEDADSAFTTGAAKCSTFGGYMLREVD